MKKHNEIARYLQARTAHIAAVVLTPNTWKIQARK